MSDRLRESVSALMDGEADELELRRLLLAENKTAVNRHWSRYHLQRDVIQDQAGISMFRDLDISAQVSEAINSQGTSINKLTSSQWLRPLTGFAVAASVAVAMVVGVQSLQPAATGLNSYEQTIAVTGQSGSASRVYPVQGASLQASGAGGVVTYQGLDLPGGYTANRAEADKKAGLQLEKYMLRHTERAAMNNGQGMVSFARVASFEVE